MSDKDKETKELTEDEKLHQDPKFIEAVNTTGNIIANLLPLQKEFNTNFQTKHNNKFNVFDYVTGISIKMYSILDKLNCWQLYKSFDKVDKDSVLKDFAECLQYLFNSFNDIKKEEDRNNIIAGFSMGYWDAKVHINPDADHKEVVKEITQTIATAVEADQNKDLTVVRMIGLLTIAIEFAFDFTVDWEDFVYYYKRSAKDLLIQLN